jgi:hypothetical protein
MGKRIAARESIYDNQVDGAYLEIDDKLPINHISCLHSFIADTLIFAHNPFFGYKGANLTLLLRQL